MKNQKQMYLFNKVHRGWHVYSKISENNYFFGEEEFQQLQINDFSTPSEFNDFLNSINFFTKKQKWYDYRLPLISNCKIKFTKKNLLYVFIFAFIFSIIISLHPIVNHFLPQTKVNIFESILITFISLLFHEFAHFYVGNINKVLIPTLGINLKWGIPLPYTDLTGINYLTKEKSKIYALSAGIIMNCLLCIISYVLSYYTKLNIFSLSFYMNFTIIFGNMMFYFKLDGYYILETFLNKNLVSYSIKDFSRSKYLLIRIYIYISFIIFFLIIIGGIFNHGIWN